MAAVSKTLVQAGLKLRRARVPFLSACFLLVFVPSFYLLADYWGFKSFAIPAVVIFSVALGLLPAIAGEAVMLLPVKALQYDLQKSAAFEAPCTMEKALARASRVFADRKIRAYDLKTFATGGEGFVLGLIGARPKPGTEVIFSLSPLFAVSLSPSSKGCKVGLFYERNSTGLTLAEVAKTKLELE